MQALKYLLQNSELYKQHNISINTEWLSNFTNETNDTSTNNDTHPHHDQSNDNKEASWLHAELFYLVLFVYLNEE